MAATVYYNKKKLCYVDKTDFTDFQPLGSDPMYKRYDSVYSVLQNLIDPEYRSFLTAPYCEEDKIYWYTEEWNEIPRQLRDLSGAEKAKYEKIKEDTVSHYKDVLSKLKLGSEDYFIMAGALKYINDDFIYCYDDKVYLVAWGMCPNENKMPVNGLWVKREKEEEKFKVTFDLGVGGHWEDDVFIGSFNRKGGVRLTKSDIPVVINNEGYEFREWSPDPVGYEITEDVTFTALYDEVPVVSDDGLGIVGVPPVEPEPELTPESEPEPKPEPKKPWYKRFGAWLRRHSWLLWVLLALLVIIILFLLLRSCNNEEDGEDTEVVVIDEDPTPTDDNIDKVYPIDKITDPDGTERDDNRPIGDKGGDNDDNAGVGDEGSDGGSTGGGGIVDDEGNLPEDDTPVVAPVFGGPAPAPIITDPDIPGNPQIIPNRLNIFFDDANADMQKWYDEFKKLYPGEEYKLNGYDPNVPMLQIEIPEAERVKIREALPKQITSVAFFVVDETLIAQGGKFGLFAKSSKGWHLGAVHAQNAWKYTKGNEDIVIAIVDDGIDAGHPIFKGRIYNAYNVFTQDRRLSVGEGHGTHVAGLAAGNLDNLSGGAAGIAPNCKIMPVQVFDNEYCTFSSLASGIMYAIHKGANVINVSIGMSLPGLSSYPLDKQKEMAHMYFRNEEKVYNHIFEVAKSKNVIIVFAAGNDNIVTEILPECRSANTINVSAVTSELKSTSFTNYEVGSTISAPGEAIYSSFPKSKYKSLDGTSMAAPIVTGAVALMLSIDRNVTVDEIIKIFQETGQRTDGRVPPMILIDRALEKLMGIESPTDPGKGGGTPSQPGGGTPGGGSDDPGGTNGGGTPGEEGGGSGGGTPGGGSDDPGGTNEGEPGTDEGNNSEIGGGDTDPGTTLPDSDSVQDSYLDELLALLKSLQAQRDALDEQINELIKKIEDARSKQK